MAATVANSGPLPPPVLNLPFGRVEGGMVYLTPSGVEFMQALWASIQGSGGLIDQSAAAAAPPGLGVGMALALIERAAAGISLQAPRPSPDTARQRDVQDAVLLAGRPQLPLSVQTLLDGLGAAQGDVIYRGASGWAALAPGTAGQFLKTQGAAADPAWATPAIGGGYTVVTTAVNYTVTATSGEMIVLVSATGKTVTLPTAVGSTAKLTCKLLVAGTLTIQPAGLELIDGGASAIISNQYGYATIISDNAAWWVV